MQNNNNQNNKHNNQPSDMFESALEVATQQQIRPITLHNNQLEVIVQEGDATKNIPQYLTIQYKQT
jgi:hypothetical protein